jgi:predicted nucleic acid-binding protein
MAVVIADTGPIVALLDQREAAHTWVRNQFSTLRDPLVTSEPVLAEAAYLLLRRGFSPERFFQLFRRGLLLPAFDLANEWEKIEALMLAYNDIPMSLADASLVRLSELHPGSTIFTLDRDFIFYRQHNRRKIPLLAPFA